MICLLICSQKSLLLSTSNYYYAYFLSVQEPKIKDLEHKQLTSMARENDRFELLRPLTEGLPVDLAAGRRR
jgi:hypothetical protein